MCPTYEPISEKQFYLSIELFPLYSCNVLYIYYRVSSFFLFRHSLNPLQCGFSSAILLCRITH